MVSDKRDSMSRANNPTCPHCRRPTQTLFIAVECLERKANGDPVRVISYDTRYTPKYEVRGCRRCHRAFLVAVDSGLVMMP